MSNIDNTYAHLTSDDGEFVADDRGGVWWPNEEAAAKIAASNDPAGTAVRLCGDSPVDMGEWRS